MRIIPIILLLLLVSCSGAKTISADLLSKSLTTVISSSLSCQNSTAVEADVKKEVDKWFGLKLDKGVGADLCKIAVMSILPALIGTTVPAAWGCSGQAPSDLAAKVCLLIP